MMQEVLTSNSFGRKMGILIGSFFLLLGVGLQGGAQSFGMFVGGRFLLGFGMCITLSSAPLLIAEISHPQDRAILSTYMGCTCMLPVPDLIEEY